MKNPLAVENLAANPALKRLDKQSQELVLAFAENLAGRTPVVRTAGNDLAIQAFIAKANPSVGDVHVSTELTNLSIAYIQDRVNFQASMAGMFGVENQAGFYTEYDRGDMFRGNPDLALLAPATESAGGGFKVLQENGYFAKVYSWHKDVDEQLMANQTVGDPVDDALAYVMQILYIIREQLFDTAIMPASLWTTELTGVSGTPGADEFKQWNDSTATPRSDISAQCVAMHSITGMWPNTFVLQPFVLSMLLLSAEITEAFKYTTAGAVPSLDALAASLMVGAVAGAVTPTIKIAGAVNTTSAEGATDAFDYVVGKKALLAYLDPNPGLRSPTAWINFAWGGLLGANAFGCRVKDLEDEFRHVPHRVEGDMAVDIKPVAPDLGCMFLTAVA